MIVRPRPHPLELLFIVRGSILRSVAPRVLTIMVLACVVVWLSHEHHLILQHAGAVPFSIIGLALSVFLGFRNNASYDRWWEGRKQWGNLVVHARSLVREMDALQIDIATRTHVSYALIGFAHALAASLRGQPISQAIQPWFATPEVQALCASQNVPDAILRKINQKLARRLQGGQLSDMLYQGLVQHLQALTSIQAACERIHNTPTPFAYSLLLHRTAWLFCLLLPFGFVSTLGYMTPLIVTLIAYTFFGLDSLGDELEEPFGTSENHLPLNAIVRIIEIDLLEVLGEQDLPERLLPQDFVLI